MNQFYKRSSKVGDDRNPAIMIRTEQKLGPVTGARKHKEVIRDLFIVPVAVPNFLRYKYWRPKK